MDLNTVTSGQEITICLYCKTYQKIHPDYPVNASSFREDTEVPRCQIHAQYTCDSCGKDRHFNGIAFCLDCEVFTCLKCQPEEIVEAKFLVYDYYYQISCQSCMSKVATLDYAETVNQHPFQTGHVRPQGTLQVWLPLGQDIGYAPNFKSWGNQKLRDMTVDIEFQSIDEEEGDSKEIWDRNAEFWKDTTRQGDLNHIHIIIPQMLEYMDVSAKKVMDTACGEGTFTRYLADAGYKVTGTDVSNLVDYAMETEKEQQKGITYHKVGVHDLKYEFDENSFEQVTMNMAIMDISDLDLILENVAYILQPNGQFVFSLTHPITAWPVAKSVKLPRDSEHNEDKGWLIDNYALEQAMKIHMTDMPGPMLYYPRKISTYVNTLRYHGFTITAMEEPVPSEDLIRKFPRHMYNDYERNPIFMVIQTILQPDTRK